MGEGYNFGPGAWIWHARTGVRPIGTNEGSFTALDVSDDGNIVVGFVRKGQFLESGFIWRDRKGPFRLDVFLNRRGAVVPAGWNFNVASLISADGKSIYGWGFNPDNLAEMFKIDLNATSAPAPR